ncbi:MAG: cupredoxin domain-containing protein [Myxococcales bacterium]|nr:cupredoxin domain-containing protein [Myxococcales bacterium]
MRRADWLVIQLLSSLLLAAAPQEQVIQVTAERFKFTPSVIQLKVGVPVVLEITSTDRRHGFQVPDLKIDENIEPGKVTRIRVVPDKAGTWDFHCSIFCGSGHEEMAGQIVVSP